MAVMHYKVRACQHGVSGFVAWCGPDPLTTDGPVTEPQEPAWFEFGKTAEQALGRLKFSLDDDGTTEWVEDK